jgi:anti-sigma B factor antagonist
VERSIDSVVVLDLAGRLALGDGEDLLQRAIQTLLARGQKQIVLNVADVSYVDSSGLGALLAVFLDARRQGGAIKLHSPTKRLRDLLTMARLLDVLDVSDSESRALAGFGVQS